jgi:hypothetical protein
MGRGRKGQPPFRAWRSRIKRSNARISDRHQHGQGPPGLATHITANEAASVTGVPPRQVHRIIDTGLLGAAVKRSRNARLLARRALVGLKLAHETADVLTPASRREVVAALIRHPRQVIVRAGMIAVDTKPAAKAVRGTRSARQSAAPRNQRARCAWRRARVQGNTYPRARHRGHAGEWRFPCADHQGLSST